MEKGNLKFKRVPKDLTEFMIFFDFFFSKLVKKLRNCSSGLVKLSRFEAIWKFKFQSSGEVILWGNKSTKKEAFLLFISNRLDLITYMY